MNTLIDMISIGLLVFFGSITAILSTMPSSKMVQFGMMILAIVTVGVGLWAFYTHDGLAKVGA
ncbi:hypothetical protein COB72_01850 [bacterium]|nr:MAG: hypothetical protein COB72_01850 [bacterium]